MTSGSLCEDLTQRKQTLESFAYIAFIQCTKTEVFN